MVQQAAVQLGGQVQATIATLPAVGLVTSDITHTQSDEALEDVTGLSVAVGANEVWAFYVVAFFNSGTTPDIKFGWSAPASATMKWASAGELGATGAPLLAVGGTDFVSGNAANRMIAYSGIFVNSSNAGTLQFQFAQNTSTASDTKVLADSYIIAWRIA